MYIIIILKLRIINNLATWLTAIVDTLLIPSLCITINSSNPKPWIKYKFERKLNPTRRYDLYLICYFWVYYFIFCFWLDFYSQFLIVECFSSSNHAPFLAYIFLLSHWFAWQTHSPLLPSPTQLQSQLSYTTLLLYLIPINNSLQVFSVVCRFVTTYTESLSNIYPYI